MGCPQFTAFGVPNSPHPHNHIASHLMTCRHNQRHNITTAQRAIPLHPFTSDHTTWQTRHRIITWRYSASHRITSQNMTPHHMTWDLATNHVASPHVASQPITLLHPPRNQPHDIISHHVTAHHITPAETKLTMTKTPPTKWNVWNPMRTKNLDWAPQCGLNCWTKSFWRLYVAIVVEFRVLAWFIVVDLLRRRNCQRNCVPAWLWFVIFCSNDL